MGWCSEDGRHEGRLVAFVRDTNDSGSQYFRELAAGGWLGCGEAEQAVRVVQAVCSCGWRSPRIFAPLGTVWIPSDLVCLPTGLFAERFEHAAQDYWAAHVTRTEDRLTWALDK